VGLGGISKKNARCVQSESSDAKSNNSPNESQAQVADLGENDGKKATKEI
jgi:hypothetical protein